MDVITRDYNPGLDNPYIYSTWSKYSWYSPPDPINVPKKEWFNHKINQIKNALSQGYVKIACLKQTPDVILGYVVARNRKVEWMCVKKDYHSQGIEHLLLRAIAHVIDHKGDKDGTDEESASSTQGSPASANHEAS